MACTWLAATAGFVARVPLAHAPTTATRGRPLACAEDPASVVSAQLRALQSGEAASLRVCHGFMSPAYHERADALERFTEWFDSPVYESLLRCSSRAVLSSPPSPTPQPHPEQVQLLEDPRRRGDERGDAGEPFCLTLTSTVTATGNARVSLTVTVTVTVTLTLTRSPVARALRLWARPRGTGCTGARAHRAPG